jgi:hypothetical protein
MQVLTSPRCGGDEERLGAPDPGGALSGAARVRALLRAALGPLIVGYAAVAAVLAVVTATAPHARFTPDGVLRAAGPAWLAAHQVPLDITGHPLGVLPLLATLGLAMLVAKSAARAARRLGYREPGEAVNIVAPMTAVHAVFGFVLALLSSGGPLDVEPLAAFGVPALIAGVAATAGVARRCGILDALKDYLDPLALHGLRAGVLGMAGLLAGGALIFALATALAVPDLCDLFAANAPGARNGLGMLLLTAGYLPNAVIGALSFGAGPGFSIGSVSVGPSAFIGGPVPGLPLLAGLPEQQASWWPVLMLLPAMAGALVGWSLRRTHDDPRTRLRTVGVAGALAGFGCVVLATLAGGRLGGGPFDPVTIPAGWLSIAAFGWIVLAGGLVTWFAGPHGEADEDGTDNDEYPEPGEGLAPDIGFDDIEEDGADDLEEDGADDPEEDGAEEDGEADAAASTGADPDDADPGDAHPDDAEYAGTEYAQAGPGEAEPEGTDSDKTDSAEAGPAAGTDDEDDSPADPPASERPIRRD